MAGRKTKYQSTFPKRVREHGEQGLTDAQMAKNLDVTLSTFEVWESEKPAFLEALKKGKAVADSEVENALFKRAFGYESKETRTEG